MGEYREGGGVGSRGGGGRELHGEGDAFFGDGVIQPDRI